MAPARDFSPLSVNNTSSTHQPRIEGNSHHQIHRKHIVLSIQSTLRLFSWVFIVFISSSCCVCFGTMELLTPASALEKSPLKDVTNSTPTPGAAIIQGANSPRKPTKSRSKRSSSVTNSSQRRSTRLSSSRSDPHPKEAEKEEELSPVRTTRSGRKVTPRVTGRKRTTKRDIQEDSVAKRRRTRRSISTLPSSPLAEKQGDDRMATTPTRPRMTRSSSMSGTEGSSIKTVHSSITVIIESSTEADEGIPVFGLL